MRTGLLLLFLAFQLTHSAFAQKVSKSERNLIKDGARDQAMYVTQNNVEDDLRILRSMSSPVKNPSNKIWKVLVKRMLSTVTDSTNKGVGIAAPQVGINRRLILVQRFDKTDKSFQAIFNPEILFKSDSVWSRTEGCLSIPDVRETVVRPWQITVKYQDINGIYITESVDGFTARIFQHEIDHLNGLLFTDYNPIYNKE